MPRTAGARGPVALWWSGDLGALTARGLLLYGRETAFFLLMTREACRLNPDLPGVPFDPVQPWDEPGGWGPALAAAESLSCRTLLIPARRGSTPAERGGARWHQPSSVFAERGLYLWLPFLHMHEMELARLADALGVPWREQWRCPAERACGRCEVCAAKKRLERILGPALSV